MTANPQLHRRYVRVLIWSTAIAAAIYGAAIVAGEPSRIWTAVSNVSAPAWSVCLFLLMFSYGLRFWRWQTYLARLGYQVRVPQSVAFYLTGFAFTATPGKAGEAVRSFYLKTVGVSYGSSLAAFFAERFLDVVVLILLAVTAALRYESARWQVLIMTFAVILAVPIFHHPRVHIAIGRFAERVSRNRIGDLADRFVNLLQSASRLLRGRTLFQGMTFGLAAWFLEALILYLILSSMHADIPLSLTVGIWAASILAGAASLLPGGLGSTEAVMTGLLIYVGVDGSVAIAATLAYRIATLWLAVALGIAVMTILEISPQAAQLYEPEDTRNNGRNDTGRQ